MLNINKHIDYLCRDYLDLNAKQGRPIVDSNVANVLKLFKSGLEKSYLLGGIYFINKFRRPIHYFNYSGCHCVVTESLKEYFKDYTTYFIFIPNISSFSLGKSDGVNITHDFAILLLNRHKTTHEQGNVQLVCAVEIDSYTYHKDQKRRLNDQTRDRNCPYKVVRRQDEHQPDNEKHLDNHGFYPTRVSWFKEVEDYICQSKFKRSMNSVLEYFDWYRILYQSGKGIARPFTNALKVFIAKIGQL